MNYWGIIPAAGRGVRMAQERPKQYLSINGSYVLEYSIAVLLQYPGTRSIVVSLAQNDQHWSGTRYSNSDRILVCDGGRQRMYSVWNALRHLRDHTDVAADDWVLVHDAVRPCLSYSTLERLVSELKEDPVGGILSSPINDSVKEDDGNGCVRRNLERHRLHLALTPQMFRYSLLFNALEQAVKKNVVVSDEAHVMEITGHRVRLVASSSFNVKLTHPDDLTPAGHWLSRS